MIYVFRESGNLWCTKERIAAERSLLVAQTEHPERNTLEAMTRRMENDFDVVTLLDAAESYTAGKNHTHKKNIYIEPSYFGHSCLRTIEPSYLHTFGLSDLRTFVPSDLRTFVPSDRRTFVSSYLRTFGPS